MKSDANGMELVRYLHNLRPDHRGCVAAVGNFDGVHVGHQEVIRNLRAQAAKAGLPAVVVTFEPQPVEYFSPATAPARLTSFREKYDALNGQSVDRMVCLRFGEALARLGGREFVEELLVRGLGVRGIAVGDDFRFGRNREGDIALLRELAGRLGYEVLPTPLLKIGHARVSSSLVRGALAAGDLDRAAVMLGRRFRISGRIAHGDRRGRELGFPTANIHLGRRRSPLHGVYAVQAYRDGGPPAAGVASIGTRPMFGNRGWVLETHLFDFEGDIYGERLEVEFLKRIRDEENFDTIDELRAQIQRDAEVARAFFARGD